ncbi:GPO family capsid scaffolding protein [Pseudomonas sp.]|uniref:GPO family capsid scaffolding protein n=1 Tax=Pseudomonas sp. TaxID=306 RepID=UPI003242206F
MSKFKSKWFRVAAEGMTTDGRTIERSWIEQMASTYSPAKYGARVWMEHIRGVLPDSPFKAYGDVLAVKAEEFDDNGKQRMGLYVQIEPTAELIALNKARQKVYTSIEVREKFADTGKAYLMGLGVTDTPASLSTEMLQFSAKNPDASPLKQRKENPENLFSELVEVQLEFDEVEDPVSGMKKLSDTVLALIGKSKDKSVKDDAQFADLHEAVTQIATALGEQAETFAKQQAEHATAMEQVRSFQALKSTLDQLSTDFAALKTQLEGEPNHQHRQRPAATGGDGKQLATF